MQADSKRQNSPCANSGTGKQSTTQYGSFVPSHFRISPTDSKVRAATNTNLELAAGSKKNVSNLISIQGEANAIFQSCKPLYLSLFSSSPSLIYLSQCCFQKLISDDRFRSENEEDAECQLPVQFLSTVASTPSLADEVQVEVMKVRIVCASVISSPKIAFKTLGFSSNIRFNLSCCIR